MENLGEELLKEKQRLEKDLETLRAEKGKQVLFIGTSCKECGRNDLQLFCALILIVYVSDLRTGAREGAPEPDCELFAETCPRGQ